MTMTTAGSACHRAAAYSSTLILVFSAFALFGLLFGVWQAVLPDLQRALRLSPGALGTALTGGFLASFPWKDWNPATALEWRGWLTVETLLVLRAYGRLP
jgi:hypothetical protein